MLSIKLWKLPKFYEDVLLAISVGRNPGLNTYTIRGERDERIDSPWLWMNKESLFYVGSQFWSWFSGGESGSETEPTFRRKEIFGKMLHLILGSLGTLMSFFGIFTNLYVLVVLLRNKKVQNKLLCMHFLPTCVCTYHQSTSICIS